MTSWNMSPLFLTGTRLYNTPWLSSKEMWWPCTLLVFWSACRWDTVVWFFWTWDILSNVFGMSDKHFDIMAKQCTCSSRVTGSRQGPSCNESGAEHSFWSLHYIDLGVEKAPWMVPWLVQSFCSFTLMCTASPWFNTGKFLTPFRWF